VEEVDVGRKMNFYGSHGIAVSSRANSHKPEFIAVTYRRNK
jgi:hypothetical protein